MSIRWRFSLCEATLFWRSRCSSCVKEDGRWKMKIEEGGWSGGAAASVPRADGCARAQAPTQRQSAHPHCALPLWRTCISPLAATPKNSSCSRQVGTECRAGRAAPAASRAEYPGDAGIAPQPFPRVDVARWRAGGRPNVRKAGERTQSSAERAALRIVDAGSADDGRTGAKRLGGNVSVFVARRAVGAAAAAPHCRKGCAHAVGWMGVNVGGMVHQA